MAFFEGIKMTGGYGEGPDIISSCSVNVNQGEIVSILGPNGAGKSTAMKAMLGLLNLKSGQVIIDGKDIWNILSGKEDEKSPHENFFYFFNGRLEAVRSGPWKYREINNKAQLFNLNKDIGERNNVLLENPIIVKKMKKYMEEMEDELGKGSILGKGVRKAGWITNPTPLNFESNN